LLHSCVALDLVVILLRCVYVILRCYVLLPTRCCVIYVAVLLFTFTLIVVYAFVDCCSVWIWFWCLPGYAVYALGPLPGFVTVPFTFTFYICFTTRCGLRCLRLRLRLLLRCYHIPRLLLIYVYLFSRLLLRLLRTRATHVDSTLRYAQFTLFTLRCCYPGFGLNVVHLRSFGYVCVYVDYCYVTLRLRLVWLIVALLRSFTLLLRLFIYPDLPFVPHPLALLILMLHAFVARCCCTLPLLLLLCVCGYILLPPHTFVVDSCCSLCTPLHYVLVVVV